MVEKHEHQYNTSEINIFLTPTFNHPSILFQNLLILLGFRNISKSEGYMDDQTSLKIHL